MCQFFSGIITKNKTIADWDNDSHEELIKKSGLKDTTINPEFVRVELLPQDGNIFNHKIDNWKLKVDQDYKPDWFNAEWAEGEMREEIKRLWKERFIISGKVERIEKGRYWVGGSAQVENIYGSAQVKNICGSAQVEYICGSAQVENICGSAQVENICGSAQVKYISGSAQVENICGSAQVKYISGRSVCCFTGKDAKFEEIKENGIAILYYKDNPEIVVANKGIKLTVQ